MATATLSRPAAVKEDIVYFVLSPNRRHKAMGTYFVSDSANPEREGTRVKIKEEFPKYAILPSTDTVLDVDGNAIQIRYIKGCKYLNVEDQKKYKFQPRHSADRIEIIDGGIAVDAKRQPEKLAYIRACGYNVSNPNRDPKRVGVVMEMNFDAEALKNLQTKYNHARALIKIEEMSMDDALNLVYKYGFVHDANAGEGAIKEILIEIAEDKPEFILDGLQNQNDRRIVLARKAIEQGYITLNTPGTVCWQQDGVVKNVICNVGDLGGESGKFERFVTFLSTIDGTSVVNRIAEIVGDVEFGDLKGESITKNVTEVLPGYELLKSRVNVGREVVIDLEESEEEVHTKRKQGRPKKSR